MEEEEFLILGKNAWNFTRIKLKNCNSAKNCFLILLTKKKFFKFILEKKLFCKSIKIKPKKNGKLDEISVHGRESTAFYTPYRKAPNSH